VTVSPLSPDPVQAVLEGHAGVTSWLRNLRAALGALAGEPSAGFAPIEGGLREQVREHVLFLEDRLLPTLLGLDPEPAVATLVDELRRDHLAILADCSRLCADLAGCLATDDADAVLAAHTRARGLQERVLAATRRERDQLIPLVRRHREALSLALAA
jgi:hypothetical protein